MTDNDVSAPSIADGLRELASWYEAHPEIHELFAFPEISVASFPTESKPVVQQIAKALGSFDKDFSSLLELKKNFGPVKLRFVFWRDAVCTKRVVKTETVEETVPDPDAPKVTRLREREVVEWDCPPLLGS